MRKPHRKKLFQRTILLYQILSIFILFKLSDAGFGDRLKPLKFKSSISTPQLSSSEPRNPFLPEVHHEITSTYEPPISTDHSDQDLLPEAPTTITPTVTLPYIENASPDPELDSRLEYPPLPPSMEAWNVQHENISSDWRIPTGNPAGNSLHPFEDLMNRLKLLKDDIVEGLTSSESTEDLLESTTDRPNIPHVTFDDDEDAEDTKFKYALEPPELVANNLNPNDSISSSDTYSRFRYASPPYSNPMMHKKKVLFYAPMDPKPGHHHSPLPLHKVYSGLSKVIKKRVYDVPLYKDHRPRHKFLQPHHRIPPHLHVIKYPSSYKLPAVHSHEYHHHPNNDYKFYGYIPGIPGKPWKDYPLYTHVPRTVFHCKLVKYPGFYADIDTGCQVSLEYHL